MSILIKLFVVIMTVTGGQFVFSEPLRAPEPVVVDEEAQTITKEVVRVDVQGEAEEVYPDFEVIDATDNHGNQAIAPSVPGYIEKVNAGMVDGVPSEAGLQAMEEYWTLFWAMNPQLGN